MPTRRVSGLGYAWKYVKYTVWNPAHREVADPTPRDETGRKGHWMRHLYVVIGMVSLGLGVLGVALPILPTTPFLLITLYCFAKGSQRFHDWFTSTRLYRRHLAEFVATRAMTLRAKINILALASMMLAFAFILCDNLHARIAIVILAAAKYCYFFFRIRTIDRSGAISAPPLKTDPSGKETPP